MVNQHVLLNRTVLEDRTPLLAFFRDPQLAGAAVHDLLQKVQVHTKKFRKCWGAWVALHPFLIESQGDESFETLEGSHPLSHDQLVVRPG